ncbi:MAG: hybrid sensor histidine kinase/response regulator [Comamonadaceae bacterium]|nr:MAG: hybrid sensor histidine kinase/response regulator [Comamonadaceae bacterium]
MAPVAPPAHGQLRVRGNLQNDLLRLGVLPCAVAAFALTAWFTHSRLNTLESAFNAEGHAVALQVAGLSDLSLYAGDLPALQNVANAALRGGQVTRIEISNSAGVYVTAGANTVPVDQLRVYTAPVTLREASRATAFSPAGASTAGQAPIGLVQAFRDTTAYSRERTRSLVAGIGIALVALMVAWAAVRRMARTVTRPLRRISRTVAALKAGQFEARCEVIGGSEPPERAHELARLAHDVNRLAERLQRNQQISEDRVREATSVALERMADAEQAALSRARFLAAASHDLRQPLHAMGLFIDGLLPTATAAQRPAVQRLQESTAFMGVLLDDLLEISRLDAQVLMPTVASVSLATLFDQLSAQHAAQAAEAGVRVAWKARGLAVRSDPALLQRVIGNLVANAIRHAPDGTVLVAARRRSDGVCIEVRDNGVGIAPIHQARIFEEFYQVANTERDRRQGFGLGLAICSRIARLLGTRIVLRSALQAGSNFSLTLPGAEAPPTAVRAAAEAPAVLPLSGLHCLVVDDDPAILDGSRTLLVQWGCRVDCVATVADALALLSAPDNRFDVVLCDLQLAGDEDGMAVIRSARQLQPEALPVLVSGATGPETLQRLRQDGVILLTKPVAPAKLRALLATRRSTMR